MIKAIETHWKGYRFRSRLEARWAVFFEEMGWKWKYEHQGYEIGYWDDGSRIKWLPDFEIEIPGYFQKGQRAYVEVKGDKSAFKDGRFCEALDFNGGPPLFQNSFWDAFAGQKAFDHGEVMPILILGDIPRQEWGHLFLKVVGHHKGVCAGWFMVTPKHLIGQGSSILWGAFQQKEQEEVICYAMEDFDPVILPTPLASKQVMDALAAARSARFEHGEKPRVLS